MAKRGKLEIIKDILTIIKENKNSIKVTPLLRQSNLSSSRFKEYHNELISKGIICENNKGSRKCVSLTGKGERFLDKYRTIVSFIDEFEL